ncbi:hypothetical protein [Nonomuraea solani]|nr:hypothetical protein [Nonomuraea solani]
MALPAAEQVAVLAALPTAEAVAILLTTELVARDRFVRAAWRRCSS